MVSHQARGRVAVAARNRPNDLLMLGVCRVEAVGVHVRSGNRRYEKIRPVPEPARDLIDDARPADAPDLGMKPFIERAVTAAAFAFVRLHT
jgi:hypothetical protein